MTIVNMCVLSTCAHEGRAGTEPSKSNLGSYKLRCVIYQGSEDLSAHIFSSGSQEQGKHMCS